MRISSTDPELAPLVHKLNEMSGHIATIHAKREHSARGDNLNGKAAASEFSTPVEGSGGSFNALRELLARLLRSEV